MLSKLYEKGKIYQYNKMLEGIKNAKNEGKYKGRKKKEIEDTEFYEIYKMYKNKTLSLEDAINKLGISKATFYRKVKELSI